MYLNWFKTLPLFYENEEFRAVHACWESKRIDFLKKPITKRPTIKPTKSLYRENICCIDYSVAKKGKLAAYQFDGEQELDNAKLIYV